MTETAFAVKSLNFLTLLDVLIIHREALLSSQEEEPWLAVTKPRRVSPYIVFVGFIYSFFFSMLQTSRVDTVQSAFPRLNAV